MLRSKIENAERRKKRPQRVVAWEKQPQRETSFKRTAYKVSNLLIKIHVT